jgi:hypothetical protein
MFYVGHESNNIFFQFQYDIQLIYLQVSNIIQERNQQWTKYNMCYHNASLAMINWMTTLRRTTILNWSHKTDVNKYNNIVFF